MGIKALTLWVMLPAVNLMAADVVNVVPPTVGPTKKLVIAVNFDTAISSIPDSSRYWLSSGTGEKVFCVHASVIGKARKRIGFVFQITPANVAVFEKLVSDSVGYFLWNDEQITFEDHSSLEPGRLQDSTRNRIGKISQEDWNRYILDAYAADYLYPPTFGFGRNLGLEDSSKTIYYIEFAHSGGYIHANNLQVFWGAKGRWSTEGDDKLNYAQFSPIILLFSSPVFKFDASVGIETGYLGFSKEGRSLAKGELQYRLPYNPIDFTFGCPRVRINPVIALSYQGNIGWSDTALPDSLKTSADVIGSLRYDIPIGTKYYLQTSVGGDYTSTTKQLLYQYDLSLGYILDGTIHLAAEYKQGYQSVSYKYDKQLLIGLGLEILNQSSAKP